MICKDFFYVISLLIRDGSDYATVAQPRNLGLILDRDSFRLVKAVRADHIFPSSSEVKNTPCCRV
jgi:hypothetical protein